MELKKRDGGWWIEDAEPYYIDGAGPFVDYGPYDTKAQAADDLRGLREFERMFVTDYADGDQGSPSAGRLEAIPASAAETELIPVGA